MVTRMWCQRSVGQSCSLSSFRCTEYMTSEHGIETGTKAINFVADVRSSCRIIVCVDIDGGKSGIHICDQRWSLGLGSSLCLYRRPVKHVDVDMCLHRSLVCWVGFIVLCQVMKISVSTCLQQGRSRSEIVALAPHAHAYG